MLANFDGNFKDLDNNDVIEGGSSLSLKRLVATILTGNYGDENPQPSAGEKLDRAEIATKVYKGGDVELTNAECEKIKELVGKYGTPLVVMQVFDRLKGVKTVEANTAS